MILLLEDIARIADISGRHYVTCRERGVVTGEWWESDLTVTRRGRVYPVGTLVEHDTGLVAVCRGGLGPDTSYTLRAWSQLESLFGYPALPAYAMPRGFLRWDPTATD